MTTVVRGSDLDVVHRRGGLWYHGNVAPAAIKQQLEATGTELYYFPRCHAADAAGDEIAIGFKAWQDGDPRTDVCDFDHKDRPTCPDCDANHALMY